MPQTIDNAIQTLRDYRDECDVNGQDDAYLEAIEDCIALLEDLVRTP